MAEAVLQNQKGLKKGHLFNKGFCLLIYSTICHLLLPPNKNPLKRRFGGVTAAAATLKNKSGWRGSLGICLKESCVPDSGKICHFLLSPNTKFVKTALRRRQRRWNIKQDKKEPLCSKKSAYLFSTQSVTSFYLLIKNPLKRRLAALRRQQRLWNIKQDKKDHYM